MMSALPLIVLATSLLTGIFIFFLPEKFFRVRSWLNMLGASLKVAAVFYIVHGVFAHDTVFETRFSLAMGFDFLLRVDRLSLLFVTLSSALWFVTTLYAIGYLEKSPHQSRFFGFFGLCVTASTGIALAGNLITFFIFFELLTLTTYPLVVHDETKEARNAGRTYLWYTISGGTAFFVGIVWLYNLTGPFDFTAGGILNGIPQQYRAQCVGIFAIMIGGLGVKAALVPLHGWLPVAMVAPAPVSALLHAVAVVKAGVFGIARVVYDVFGLETAQALGLLFPLGILAAITIIYGSLRALAQDNLKKRLAYSTVSQLSYIILGISMIGPIAMVGGLVHLIHQGIMKITLFFCAGALAETLGIHKISELNGAGRRMPLTMAAFTVGALGMIGIPPLAGFISKWYLATGSVAAGQSWVVAILLVSSLLNALYFLPLVHAAWFREPDPSWAERHPKKRGLETQWMLLVPTVTTAVLSLAAGIWAGSAFSPLQLAISIAETFYLQR